MVEELGGMGAALSQRWLSIGAALEHWGALLIFKSHDPAFPP